MSVKKIPLKSVEEIVLNITPVVVILILALTVIIIPFRVIGYGFLPGDDALRHSAKVISGKPWSEILVLRPEIKMDSHPGWHAILGAVRKATDWDANSLVLFSVISLSIIFFITPIFLIPRPETWAASLITLALFSPYFFFRLFLGRPYIFTMSLLLALLFLWPKLNSKKVPLGVSIVLTILIAASTWIHCSWYLFVLPLAAFLLARKFRAAGVFAVSAVTGVLAGSMLTGHPVMFLKQTLMHLFLAFGNNDAEYMLVSEFRPSLGDANLAILAAIMIGWGVLRGRKVKDIVDNPVFIMASLAFLLGLVTRRAWLDWGVPAMAVWMALLFEDFFGKKIPALSWRRIPLAVLLAGVLYLSVTTDAGSRWTSCKPIDCLSAEDPKQAEWLPESGGIIYTDSMGVFYQTFYRNPRANWRYIIGFEPTLMPKEDLEIYRNIQRNRWTYKPFEAWVKKMRPEDRLIITAPAGSPPKIGGLDWNYTALNTWIGRLPKNGKGSRPFSD